jgi:site-specific recombinase XerC
MADPVGDHLKWMALRDLSPTTIRTRRSVLGTLARSIAVPILEATPDDLLLWRCGMTDLVSTTIAGYLSHMHEFYRWAVRTKRLLEDPSTEVPAPKTPHRIPRPIGYDDLVMSVSCVTEEVRTWIILAAWCGMRCCEIARLRTDYVTLTGPAPSILIAADATKGVRERVVPLSPYVVGELLAAGLPSRGWAFRRRDGRAGHPAAWRVSQLVAEALRGLGINATAHMLRHWAGTEFYEASEHDLRATQEFLGHRRIDTTALYTQVRPGRGLDVVLKMPVPRLLRAVS